MSKDNFRVWWLKCRLCRKSQCKGRTRSGSQWSDGTQKGQYIQLFLHRELSVCDPTIAKVLPVIIFR